MARPPPNRAGERDLRIRAAAVTEERWGRIRPLFFELAELGPEARAARLAKLSEADPAVRVTLERLLAAHDRADSLLGTLEARIARPSFEAVGRPGNEEPPPDPYGLVGRRVSHYEVDAVLGAGGMGVLYRATDVRLGRTVALKFLPPRWSLDPAYKKRFLREARAAAALDHPNVCAIHDVGETAEGQLFLALAFYQGETVQEKLARGPLPVGEALELARQAAAGLAAAHRAALVHRDVKPANLMVTREGTLKVLDFGLAKTGESALTESGVRLGTPAYMSPEQAEGEEVDAATDLWSLGVVLYEMLTGVRPFRGVQDAAVLDAIRRAEPRPPGELCPDLPPEVDRLVLTLLSGEPAERLPAAGPLSDELAGSPLRAAAGRSDRPKESRRPAGWLPWVAGLAAVVLLAILGATLMDGRRLSAPLAPDLVAVLPWSLRGGPAELEYLETGLADLLSLSLGEVPGVRTLDPSALRGFVERSCSDQIDPRCISEAARRSGAARFVTGTIVPAGAAGWRLTASVFDTDHPESGRSVAEAVATEPLSTVDDLALGIATALLNPGTDSTEGVHEPSDVAARMTTTGSLPALKAFLKGEATAREIRYESAISLLRDAVTADPDFALAWYRLARVAADNGDHPLADSAIDEALARAERLPGAWARLLRGVDHFRRGEGDRAEREFRILVATDPNSPEAWYWLGETLQHYNLRRGLPPGGYDAFERALELDPNAAGALWHLRQRPLEEGRIDDFETLNDRFIELAPGAEGQGAIDFRYATAYSRLIPLLRADHDSIRRRWFADLERSSDEDVWYATQQLYGLSWPNHLDDAARAARIMTDPDRSPSSRAQGHHLLGRLAVRQGRWREAVGELLEMERFSAAPPLIRGQLASSSFLPLKAEELREIRGDLSSWVEGEVRTRTFDLITGRPDPHGRLVLWALGLQAELSARLGEFEVARRVASRLEDMPVPVELGLGTIPEDVQLMLRARISLRRGDPAAARAALDSTRFEVPWGDDGAPTFDAAYLRAETLYRLNELEEARHWYALFLRISSWRYLGPALHRLGQIHETMGEPDSALVRYRQFVELWEDADPMLQARVQEARDRIADLR